MKFSVSAIKKPRVFTAIVLLLTGLTVTHSILAKGQASHTDAEKKEEAHTSQVAKLATPKTAETTQTVPTEISKQEKNQTAPLAESVVSKTTEPVKTASTEIPKQEKAQTTPPHSSDPSSATPPAPDKTLWYSLLALLSAFAALLIVFISGRSSKMAISNPINNDIEVKSSSNQSNLKWLIVAHSAKGKGHIKNGTPCQDNHYIERIDEHWGVAVSCDGAGSKSNSHHGSKFVAEHMAKTLAFAIKEHKWHTSQQLPNEQVWRELSIQIFYKTYTDLTDYAQKQNMSLDSLGCTVIAVIYSPIGLLVAHIGDGRAAYLSQQSEWHSMIQPFKGEEANQTVFITSAIWRDTDKFIESRVINEPPLGFTLLSDGCEGFAFETYMNTSAIEGELKIEDINKPFNGFYDYAIERLKTFHEIKDSYPAIQAEWQRILEKGTNKIENEPDDKTMILGLWL